MDASGDVPPLDGPCYWSEDDLATLVDVLSASIILPPQCVSPSLLFNAPTPGNTALSPSCSHAAVFPSTTLTSPEAGPSSIPQDALTTPEHIEYAPQYSSKKRSRSVDIYEVLPPPSKKTRTHEGEVPDLQTTQSWGAAALNMAPYYVEAPVAGPSNFIPWTQSVSAEDIDNRESLEQSRDYEDTLPEANDDQAHETPLPVAPPRAKRFRRTNAEIAPTLMPGIRKMPCGFPGCQKTVHPKSGETNREHIKADHYTAAQLKSKDKIVCRWAACGKPMEGNLIMAHIEENHIGFGYKCLFRDCPIKWKGCRAKDYSQHMDKKHAGWRE